MQQQRCNDLSKQDGIESRMDQETGSRDAEFAIISGIRCGFAIRKT
jgi:hypothetical protein